MVFAESCVRIRSLREDACRMAQALVVGRARGVLDIYTPGTRACDFVLYVNLIVKNPHAFQLNEDNKGRRMNWGPMTDASKLRSTCLILVDRLDLRMINQQRTLAPVPL